MAELPLKEVFGPAETDEPEESAGVSGVFGGADPFAATIAMTQAESDAGVARDVSNYLRDLSRLGAPEVPVPVVTATEIELRVVGEAAPPPTPPEDHEKKKREKKAGDGGAGEGEGKDAPLAGLPPCVLLTKDGRLVKGYQVEKWPDDFTMEDGGFVEDLGEEGSIFKINLDNSYYLKYFASERGDTNKSVITQKYILGMRVLMLGFEQALRAKQNTEGFGEYADVFRRAAAKGAASTVLGIAQVLPRIVNSASMDDEEVVE